MLKVGLTGGIATGKSHSLSVFRSLGCHIIDADEVARVVVEPGQPAHQEIVQSFGSEVLTETGAIDRARLAAIVFNDAGQRERLNSIVHPRIMDEIGRRFTALEQADPEGIAIVDGALIIESGVHPFFDVLIVVYCGEEEQVSRLMSRDGLSRQDALLRIQAQMPSDEKRKYADIEIDTSGTPEQTREQVRQVYHILRARTRNSNQSASV